LKFFWSRNGTTLVAFVIALVLVVADLIIRARLGVLTGSRAELMTMTTEITAGAVLGTATALIATLAQTWRARTRFAQVLRFFGMPFAGPEITIVFPRWETTNPEYLRVADQLPPNSKFATPTSCPKFVAFEDLEAAKAIADVFREYHVNVEIAHDRPDFVDQDLDRPIIALGLESVSHASYAIARYSNAVGIDWTETPGKIGYIKIDGEELPRGNGSHDYAFIVRLPYENQRGQRLTCFMCAGRTAKGTEAAGRFLRKCWASLLAAYDEKGMALDKFSMVVVVAHDNNAALNFWREGEPKFIPYPRPPKPLPAGGTEFDAAPA
jgi:hypothetical protein